MRSVLEYGAIIWDPYTNKEIDKIENIQRRAARFIKHDYKSRNPGCITEMLNELELPSLQDRRKDQRLAMFYKVVEGLVPAIAPEDYLIRQKPRRNIRAKSNSDFVTTNILERRETKNSKPFQVIDCKSEVRKNSFFPRTIIDWNHLEDKCVCSASVEGFVTALQHFD